MRGVSCVLAPQSEDCTLPHHCLEMPQCASQQNLVPNDRCRSSKREFAFCGICQLPNFGRGVPRTAIAATTSSQKGSTPNAGIASRASPGNSSHWRPRTIKSSSTVAISTTQTSGGKGVANAPMASERPAIVKARASRFFENLTVCEEGVLTLVGCSLGSVGGGVI